MRVSTDESRIRRGARLGKIGIFAGLASLAAGLVISLTVRTPSLLWLPFVFLLLGVVASSIGTANVNRWLRPPRADQALEQALKGLDDAYRLYNYLLPAPHVLVGPAGLFVLTALGQDGEVRYADGKFRRKFSAGRLLRFMADEGLGRPFAQGDAEVHALRQFLDRQGAGEGVDIQNVLVFYHPRVQLSVADPPRPVVVPKGLKRALRKQAEGGLTPAQLRQLQEVFDRAVG